MKNSKITQNEKAAPSAPVHQFKNSVGVIDHRPTASAQLQRQKLSDQSQQSAQLKQHLGHLNTDQHATAQRQVEEEPTQKKADITQRVELDEEPAQAKFDTTQRVEEEEPAQRAEIEEEPIQGKFDTVQRMEEEEPAQKKSAEAVNNTGLPNQLKAGIESMSGMSMDHVKVHYNSDKPAQLNAHAYAQGSDIHVAPGQEQHLPHEAWHVVQQAQGRVKPTMQMKMGVPINDDTGLENEADVMGAKAMQLKSLAVSHTNFESPSTSQRSSGTNSIQRRTLAQAGRHNGMAEIADQALIGGDVGPTQGSAYVAPLGVQATKTAALSAAGASYAAFVADKPVANLLSRTRICEAINTARDPITNYIAGLEGDAVTTTADAATHIKTNILRPIINPTFKTDVDDGELTAILTAVRAPITKNGANKFFANPLGAAPLTTYVRNQIRGGWRANANVPPIDPFLYRAHATIGGANFSVSYQHSHDWPGYVTHIQDDGTTASMRVAGAIANPDVAGIPDQFGRKHHETGNDNLANDLTLDPLDTRVNNERRLDSMTKLAGEGARFICVRNNLGIMTDKSRFYVMGDDETRYVTLEDLWSSWATGFNKQNDISVADVRAAIVGGAVWTYDHQDGQEARVFSLFDDAPMGGADVNLT